jgi:hypothetical protein
MASYQGVSTNNVESEKIEEKNGKMNFFLDDF